MSPMRRDRYPRDWEAISLAAIERAGNVCQKCGVKNGEVIARLKRDPFQFRYVSYGETEDWAAFGWHDKDYKEPILVVLTTHHWGAPWPDGTPGDPDNKFDCRPENLLAVCQRCHIKDEGRVRRERKNAPPPAQLPLFTEMDEDEPPVLESLSDLLY